MNKVLFSSNSDEWYTPLDLYQQLDNHFHFTLDPCSSLEFHLCKNYFTINDDGLSKSWGNNVAFVNPPYSNIGAWVKKCYDEFCSSGSTIVLLIPVRTDTKYFHNYIYHVADLYFIKGRLHFSNSKYSAPFPSMVCVFHR